MARRIYRKKKKGSRARSGGRPGARSVRRMPLYGLRTQKTSYQGTFQFLSTLTSGFWRYFDVQALSMPEWAQYQALFDEYKLTNIKFTFRPRYDSHDVNSSTAGQTSAFPVSYSHIIKDPASTKIPAGVYSIATLNEFLENGSIKTFTNNKPFSVSFKPKVLTNLFGGGTAAKALSAPWIRTTEDTIPHRGFHMFIQNNALNATNASILLDVFITYSIQFRGAR